MDRLIIVHVVIVGIIWWRRSKTVKKETAQLHPFQVTSDLEMALTNADNQNNIEKYKNDLLNLYK